MLDRSLLPPAMLEFVTIADTHYMEDPGSQTLEFESRRLQAGRVAYALGLVSSISPDFTVHLGDMTQLCADAEAAEAFWRAVEGARAQLEAACVKPHHVAGNQDIGDKPDPTMPNAAVTPAALDAYQARFGPSWYSWDSSGCHFVVLNTQVMNTTLPEAEEQRRWLEEDLAARRGKRLFVFLHLPLYLYNAREPHLGHYDNLGQPAREWLLTLLSQHHAEAVFAGHSHYFFVNQLGETRYFVTPSTSFTRPGFGELFSAAAPDDRGRNDIGKVGFFLVRIQDDAARVHFIRTQGTTSPADAGQSQKVVARQSRDLPTSPLGITLRHPLVQIRDVPSAWPSLVRQRVRNDYPLLACIELGVRYLRVPVWDLSEEEQRRGFELLRTEGIRVCAFIHWHESVDLIEAASLCDGLADLLEVQLLGDPLPPPRCIEQIGRWSTEVRVPLALSTALPGERYRGRQLPRTRIGYSPDELTRLDSHLALAGVSVERVLCRVGPDEAPWNMAMRHVTGSAFKSFAFVDWLVELPASDERSHVTRAASALFAAALTRGSRVYLEPLIDLDRTMDVSHGLLDRLCNPRPAYDAVRVLNSVMFASAERFRVEPSSSPQPGLLRLDGEARSYTLCLPPENGALRLVTWADDRVDDSLGTEAAVTRIYDLAEGTSEHFTVKAGMQLEVVRNPRGPILIVAPKGHKVVSGTGQLLG